MKTEYHLFICDISGEHAPICVFISESPFPNFMVGQRFDDHGWERIDGCVIGSEQNPVRFTIHSIKHVITVKNGKNIVQTGLNIEPFTGDRSPAFGNIEPSRSWLASLNLKK